MKNALILIVIIAVIVGGFFLFKSLRGPEITPVTTGKTVELTLLTQGNSGESGTATLTDMDGKLKVSLALTGAPVGVAQPSHIHAGSCENLGSPRYTLTDVSGGSAETELAGVTVDQLLGELPLAINVHKSTQEAGIYVACGNIVAPGTSVVTPSTTETATATSTATSTTATTTIKATTSTSGY